MSEPLSNAVHILYVSPLKALNNDIQRNLERPLAELRERFAAAGETFPGDSRRRSHGRHARVGARADASQVAAHSHHDARVAAHHADERARTRHVQRRARRDRRRDSRDGGHEARRAPGAHARASRALSRAIRRSASDSRRRRSRSTRSRGFSSGGDRELHDRRLRARQAARAVDRLVRSTISRTSAARSGRRSRRSCSSTCASARTTLIFVNNRAQAEKMAARINALGRRGDRAAVSRLAVARATPHARAVAQGGHAARARQHELARAGHRHRIGGSRAPAAVAEARRERTAARRPRRPLARRGESRRLRADLPRRRDGAARHRRRR